MLFSQDHHTEKEHDHTSVINKHVNRFVANSLLKLLD